VSRPITYLDASAIVKVVVAEEHSSAPIGWLSDRPSRSSSALARVEVLRAVRWHGPGTIARALATLRDVSLLALDDRVLEAAAMVDPVVLRSLDAIHLATARSIGTDLDVLVSYDQRMLEGARSLGLPTASPT
jgi:predicted nucleic acid-binding protein